jgi:hypothetical protein
MRVGRKQSHNIQSYHISSETKLYFTTGFMWFEKATLRGYRTPTDEQ